MAQAGVVGAKASGGSRLNRMTLGMDMFNQVTKLVCHALYLSQKRTLVTYHRRGESAGVVDVEGTSVYSAQTPSEAAV